MQALGHLASGVAHDLSNLLAAIMCNAASLRRKLRGNLGVEGELESLELATQAAGGIVQSLLSCQRCDGARAASIKLNGLLDDTVRLLKLILPSCITVRVEMDSLPIVWVTGDRSRLQQVLLNLAVNARDAMPNGGTLCISVASVAEVGASREARGSDSPASFVCIEVSDTGFGMSAEHVSRIFEPLFTTKASGHGTGLGLAIVRDAVQAHGGRIQVHSEPGRGTTFKILLPMARPHGVPTMFDNAGPFIAG